MSLSAPKKTSFKIGLIIGSQRQPRCGDQIASFVLSTIKIHLALQPPSPSGREITFQTIDIALLGLPLFDEPGIPSQIRSPTDYMHEHTRSWSRTISPLDGFIFVTPQYNWGIPAGLKNAIDYLFHEWKGKPAMIVSYGGHGGDKAAAALKVVLGGGLDMRVVDGMVNLAFPSRQVLYTAASGGDLGLEKGDGEEIWASERAGIVEVWGEMEKLLQT